MQIKRAVKLGLMRRVTIPSGAPAVGGSNPTRDLTYMGVNLSGLEYGNPDVNTADVANGYNVPYTSSIDDYVTKGANTFRIPVMWERLQPSGNNTALDATYLGVLTTLVNYITVTKGCYAIVDLHNYGSRRFASDGWVAAVYLTDAGLPASAFADVWSRLASTSALQHAKVIYDLMNEPTAGSSFASAFITCVNAAISAIRTAGRTNLILVPGLGWSEAAGWYTHASNTVMAGVVDSGNNWAPEVHQYYDADYKGDSDDTISGMFPVGALTGVREWAIANNRPAFLGEFNVNYATYTSQDNVNKGRNALRDTVSELAAYPTGWIGWTAWRGGGRIGGNDITNLDPWSGGFVPGGGNDVTPVSDGSPRDKTTILSGFWAAHDASTKPWLMPNASIDLDLARNRVHGVADFATALGCTRASTVSAAKEDGTFQSFTANVLRRTNKGLAVDSGVSNLISPSNDFANVAWTKDAGVTLTAAFAAGPDIGSGAVAGAATRFVTNAALKSIQIPSTSTSSTRRQSIYIKSNTGSSQSLEFWSGSSGTGVTATTSWTRVDAPMATSNAPNFNLYSIGAAIDVLIAYAQVELGTSPTTYVPTPATGEVIALQGALLTALQGDCTIVIQWRELPSSGAVELLAATIGGTATSLLTRKSDGGVSTALGGAQTTAAQTLTNYNTYPLGRRKAGLSKRASAGRVVVGVSGAASVGANNTPGTITAATLGLLNSVYANGLCERITLYPVFTDTTAMDALLA